MRLLSTVRGPLLMPAPVLTEVCYLLETRRGPELEADFLSDVADGVIELVDLTRVDVARMVELVRRYADLPLGAADASVIAIAERLGITDIATLDRKHFSIVRPRHVSAFTVLP
ncbi:type II toxin-antitoxin system VapC family toxin [Pseudonocardia nigra]|uniref:type II toxin-antitoxin system VapC family toxin n=1 Tax=Pseudonocardia nigra TaxID=1921578 RepID=UPI001C5E8A8A|nr:PIN domain-containing protein [Pseudonocardia nigra]